MINGIDKVIITLLDALEGIDPIKMCVGYKYQGKSLESWPIQHEIIQDCQPVYEEFSGWESRSSKDWTKIAAQGFNALPETMKVYLEKIKTEINTEISMVSIGPKRNDTIVLNEDFF
jgi:adenylosuccinate synthase